MLTFTIYFKCSLVLQYNEMIQLFNQLFVPPPYTTNTLCQTTTSNGQTIFYSNWGYAQIDVVILTSGQKYNIKLENPGYVVLNLGYYIDVDLTINSSISPNSIDYYYSSFNLNDYNNYINSSNIVQFEPDLAIFNSTAMAYGYVDSNGFTIDLTGLNPYYAVILGLLKFDTLTQFSTYTRSGYTYNIYGMSTALNNVYTLGIRSATINTNLFLGIPINTSVQFNSPYSFIGYQLNDNFLINDEVVSNSAFNFTEDESNVAGLVQYASPAELIQSPPMSASPGYAFPIEFGSPENIQYSSVIIYSNDTYTSINSIGSEPASGLPNTNAISANNITLPLIGFGGNVVSLKSLYNNNGYNDVWVFSSNGIYCSPVNSSNSNIYYILPPYFTPWNGQTYPILNSNNPSILLQYVLQPPIVQITSTSSTISNSTTQNISSSITQSSVPMTQASSSITSTTTSTSTNTTTNITSTQSTTSTTSSTTNNITITSITEKIVSALANPIVALILALALVGIAIFVLV